MTEDEVATIYADSHLSALDHFPDNKSEAKESLACFVANCIMSIGMSTEEFVANINRYIKYYKGRMQ